MIEKKSRNKLQKCDKKYDSCKEIKNCFLFNINAHLSFSKRALCLIWNKKMSPIAPPLCYVPPPSSISHPGSSDSVCGLIIVTNSVTVQMLFLTIFCYANICVSMATVLMMNVCSDSTPRLTLNGYVLIRNVVAGSRLYFSGTPL